MILNATYLCFGLIIALFGLFFAYNPVMFIGGPLDEKPATLVARVLWKFSYLMRRRLVVFFGYMMLLIAGVTFFLVIGPSPQTLMAKYRFKKQEDFSYGAAVKGELLRGSKQHHEILEGNHSLQLYYLDLEKVKAVEMNFDVAFIKQTTALTAASEMKKDLGTLLSSDQDYIILDIYELNKMDINSKIVSSLRSKPPVENADWHLKKAQDYWRQNDFATSIAHAKQAHWIRSQYFERDTPQIKEVEAMITTAKKQQQLHLSQVANQSSPPVNN